MHKRTENLEYSNFQNLYIGKEKLQIKLQLRIEMSEGAETLNDKSKVCLI